MPKTLKTHSGHEVLLPSQKDNTAINASMANQSDNPEWTDADFARALPASQVLPQLFGKAVAQELLRPRGRPRAAFPKERINIRLSHEVVQHFKAAGDGWQTRIDLALRQYLAEHRAQV